MKTSTATFLLFVIWALLFSNIGFAQSTGALTERDLLGSWSCESILHGSVYSGAPSSFAPEWKLTDGGLTVVLDGARLDFTASPDGKFSVTSSAPNPIVASSSEIIRSDYKIRADRLIFTYNAGGTNFFYEMKKPGENRLNLYPTNGFYPTITCDKVLPLSTLSTTAP